MVDDCTRENSEHKCNLTLSLLAPNCSSVIDCFGVQPDDAPRTHDPCSTSLLATSFPKPHTTGARLAIKKCTLGPASGTDRSPARRGLLTGAYTRRSNLLERRRRSLPNCVAFISPLWSRRRDRGFAARMRARRRARKTLTLGLGLRADDDAKACRPASMLVG